MPSSGVVRIALISAVGDFDELGADIDIDDEGRYFARWDAHVPLKDAAGQRAEHPAMRTPLPREDARAVASKMVEEIIRAVDVHDPGGVRHTNRVRADVIPAIMRKRLKEREARKRRNAARGDQ